MLILYSGELIPRISIRDQARDLIAPTQTSLGQIVRRYSEMCARDIQAAQHNLILQHQLPDKLGLRKFVALVADRDAGQHIRPFWTLPPASQHD
jgi:hypothetical protein